MKIESGKQPGVRSQGLLTLQGPEPLTCLAHLPGKGPRCPSDGDPRPLSSEDVTRREGSSRPALCSGRKRLTQRFCRFFPVPRGRRRQLQASAWQSSSHGSPQAPLQGWASRGTGRSARLGASCHFHGDSVHPGPLPPPALCNLHEVEQKRKRQEAPWHRLLLSWEQVLEPSLLSPGPSQVHSWAPRPLNPAQMACCCGGDPLSVTSVLTRFTAPQQDGGE